MNHVSKNLGDLISRQKDQNKIAIICETQQITYGELISLINSVAVSLKEQVILPQDRVAIISLNSIDFIALYLGILKIGAVAVLINAKLPQSQVDYILKDSKVKLTLRNLKDLKLNTATEFLSFEPNEDDPALILYTSGSTSAPKGVILPHRHKWIITQRSTNPYISNHTILLTSPLYHNAGLTTAEIAIAGHATLILSSQYDAKQFINKIEEHMVSFITGVPSVLLAILSEKELLKKTNLNSIKHIAVGGSSFNQNLYKNLIEIFPNASINNGYGLTEVGSGLFISHSTLPTPTLSVGYPNPLIGYRLVDDILEIKSPSMMLTYSNVPNDKITSDGYFITNDFFKIDDDGFYYYLGRADDMFISGGNNIYPRQIEEILENHPAVLLAAIVELEDDIKGTKPYAFVVQKSNLTESELLSYVMKNLPLSHCPRKIWIIDRLPLTDVNKIDKKKLKEQAKTLLTKHNV